MLKAAGSIFIVAGTYYVLIIVADTETMGLEKEDQGSSYKIGNRSKSEDEEKVTTQSYLVIKIFKLATYRFEGEVYS